MQCWGRIFLRGIVIMSAILIGAAMCPARELIVASDGNDTNPGTADRPLATLDGARAAVRKVLAAGE